MLPHAYPIEMAQALIALTGLIYNVRMLFDVYTDRACLVTAGKNGRRLITATAEIEQEWYRVITTSFLVIFGLFSIASPPPTEIPVLLPEFIQINVTSLRYVLIAVTVMISFKSYRARRNRRVLNEYPDEVVVLERRKHDFGPPFAMEERRKKTIPPE